MVPKARPEETEHSRQVTGVLGLMNDVLRDDVVGVYLFGSAALGGLRPRSDVDLLVVLRRPISDEEKRRVIDGLLRISGNGPWPLELTAVVQDRVRPWRYPPTMELQYGEWLRSDFESGELEPGPSENTDLACLITMVLNADRPLQGAAPRDVLDSVPRGDLARAMVEGIDGLVAELEPDTRNVVLTLARIWATLATGELRSKDAAATWALSRLPAEHRAVLERARAVYVGEEDERWDDVEDRVRPHVAHVVGEIETLYELGW